MTHTGPRRTTEPTRRCLCDWVSLTSHVENQRELEKVRNTGQRLLSDVIGSHATVELRSAGNYLAGIKWEKFGAQLKWSSATAADLIGADYNGRCVNTINFQLKGSTGIGSLRLTYAGDLLSQLQAIGYSSCRRIDLVIDVFNHDALTVRLISERLASGEWKIPRRDPASYVFHGPIIDDKDTRKGSTLYIGGRDADVQVCVYDKGFQLEQEGSWMRIEVRYRNEPAQEALYRLSDATNAAMDSADPEVHLDWAVTGMVRHAFDVRDVGKYADREKLPRNWANPSLTTYPEVMHPVFAETAPLQIGGFKAVNTFASRTRHLMRSSSKHIWRLAVISRAKGEDPGAVALTMGGPGVLGITDEDFCEMSQVCGIPIAALEEAEKQCITQLAQLHKLDIECIHTDRTEMREHFARSLGGV